MTAFSEQWSSEQLPCLAQIAKAHDETGDDVGLCGPSMHGRLLKKARVGTELLSRFVVLNARRLFYYDNENETLPMLQWLNRAPITAARGAITNVGTPNSKGFTGYKGPDSQHKGWIDLVGCTVEEVEVGVRGLYGFKVTEERLHETDPMEPLTFWADDANIQAAWVTVIRLAARPTWLWVPGVQASGMIDTVYSGLSIFGGEASDPRAKQCQVCDAAFSLFSRPSHCRRCGGVACSKCVALAPLLQLGYTEPQKQCRHCQAGKAASRFIAKLPKSDRCSANKSKIHKKAVDRALNLFGKK